MLPESLLIKLASRVHPNYVDQIVQREGFVFCLEHTIYATVNVTLIIVFRQRHRVVW
jgi:hypothetical protein